VRTGWASRPAAGCLSDDMVIPSREVRCIPLANSNRRRKRGGA
jgi:hypothetical protein